MQDHICDYYDSPPATSKSMRYVPFLHLAWREYGNEGPLGTPDRDDAGAFVTTEADVPAYISRGKWVVGCPKAPLCNEATVIAKDIPIWRCPNCTSGWHRVVFPADMADIERVLVAQPAAHPYRAAPHRNWLLSETVDDLLLENLMHDALVPADMAERAEAKLGAVLAEIDLVDEVLVARVRTQLEASRAV